MVVKQKQRCYWHLSNGGCLLQTAANLEDCPPKAEVRGSNPFGRAIFTVNKALARDRVIAACFPSLTFHRLTISRSVTLA